MIKVSLRLLRQKSLTKTRVFMAQLFLETRKMSYTANLAKRFKRP